MILPAAAVAALTNNQRQLDQDGVEVAVSRQALEEVLAYVAQPAGAGGGPGLRRTAAEEHLAHHAALGGGGPDNSEAGGMATFGNAYGGGGAGIG